MLPILFANRSAALFKMNRFTDCVEDIDEALRLGYPEKLQYKVPRSWDWWNDGERRTNLDLGMWFFLQVLERKAKALEKLGQNCVGEVDQLSLLIQKVT